MISLNLGRDDMKQIYVAAAVIINDNKDKILVTKRRGGPFDGLWEFPGGKIEKDETSEEATIREIQEELSLTISIVKYFTTIKYQYDSFHLTMDLHWSVVKSGKLVLNEHADYRWAFENELEDLNWVPADIQLINLIKESSFLQ